MPYLAALLTEHHNEVLREHALAPVELGRLQLAEWFPLDGSSEERVQQNNERMREGAAQQAPVRLRGPGLQSVGYGLTWSPVVHFPEMKITLYKSCQFDDFTLVTRPALVLHVYLTLEIHPFIADDVSVRWRMPALNVRQF